DRNRSHWSTSKTPSYTKSVSWQHHPVKVSGHLSSNSGEIVLQWALEGKGIMLRSEWDVLPFLESGKLVQVLPEYAQSANIWAVYREPLYRSMKLRVCVEFLAAWCQQRLGKPDEGYQVM
ncbi:LysR substrate-binding domain-containing protein, partial [Escherichia coli]|uniref:LysR substrate-binding domain-containing protein n=2 Tax=Escherichia coli TaxID=562 RepID=UPI002041C9DB